MNICAASTIAILQNDLLADLFFIGLSTSVPIFHFIVRYHCTQVALALDSVCDTVLQRHRCDPGGSHTARGHEGMDPWDGVRQTWTAWSASSLLPEIQSEPACSGKLQPEKVQLFHTERDAENYSGSSAIKSMRFVLINKLNTCQILPQTSSTKKLNIFQPRTHTCELSQMYPLHTQNTQCYQMWVLQQ